MRKIIKVSSIDESVFLSAIEALLAKSSKNTVQFISNTLAYVVCETSGRSTKSTANNKGTSKGSRKKEETNGNFKP